MKRIIRKKKIKWRFKVGMIWFDCDQIFMLDNAAILNDYFTFFSFKYYFDKKKRRRRGVFRTTVVCVNKALEQEIMLRRMV